MKPTHVKTLVRIMDTETEGEGLGGRIHDLIAQQLAVPLYGLSDPELSVALDNICVQTLSSPLPMNLTDLDRTGIENALRRAWTLPSFANRNA